MSRSFDVSDFSADDLNRGIDDTNFPNSHHASASNSVSENGEKTEENGPPRNQTQPLVVKPNGFAKSFDDEVFEVAGTPRSLPTPGTSE